MAASISKSAGDGPSKLPSVDADALDTINVAPSPRPLHDSFSRRGLSPARNGAASPASMARASSHRPSPIILPPVRLGEFNARERLQYEQGGDAGDRNDGRARDSRSSTPNAALGSSNNSASQLARKRSAPIDSSLEQGSGSHRAKSYGGEDEDHCRQNTRHDGGTEDDSPGSGKHGAMVGVQTPNSADMPQHDSICFCVKAPKVPRPRNAFILYRQHYQAQVVAENPGLANPDISKIIGQMWKDQADVDRVYWKGLAEQEKQHHRIQHPDYRYQPRRTGKVDGRSIGRPGSAAGRDGSSDKGLNSIDGGGDPNRCDKCGGRYIAPLPSARSIPGSARSAYPPSSPYGAVRGTGTLSALPSLNGNESDSDRQQRQFPSPESLKNTSRRFLPHHDRPTSSTMNRGQQHGDEHGEGYDPRDLPTPSDQKRRRYDQPVPYTPRFDSSSNNNGNSNGTSHGQQHYNIPYRSVHHTGSTPPPLQLPQSPSSTPLQQFSNSSLDPSPASSWMGPPPLPLRQSMRDGYAPHPYGRGYSEAQNHNGRAPFPGGQYHPSESGRGRATLHRTAHGRAGEPGTPIQAYAEGGENYSRRSARLPPIQGGSYDYYPTPGSGGSAMATPSTAMAGLSMRSTPTPTAPMPVPTRQGGPSGTSNGQSSTQGAPPTHHSADFAVESLRLPPLMTNINTSLHAAGQNQEQPHRALPEHPDMRPHPIIAHSRLVRSGTSPTLAPISAVAAISSRIHDMRTFAVSPTPALDGRSDVADKNSQASGIRAMIMSVPYLSKLEVLRRISPPRPKTHRRGPIISIEGRNAALIEAVGRIVECALVQSGECSVGLWSTATFPKKKSTDSGVGSSIDDGMVASPASACGSDGDSDPLLAYQECIMSWRSKSQAIMQHITSTKSATYAVTATETQRDSSVAAPPSPAKSCSVQLSPASSLSPTRTPEDAVAKSNAKKNSARAPRSGSPASMSPRQSPFIAASALSAASSPSHSPHQLLPVALITGGYSLAISDHYAMTVPIDDAFPPIGHWEWMAMLWRGMAGPDLIVYADSKPRGAASGPTAAESSVNTRAQEGVMIVHASQTVAATQMNDDEMNDGDDASGSWEGYSLLDKKTERRLTFEVMEWVRSFSFGMEERMEGR